MTHIKNSLAAGIAFGVIMGLYFSLIYSFNLGLVTGIFCGLFFGLSIYLFVTSKKIKKQTEIKNLNGEIEIHSGPANHFKNTVAVGGRLYLFKDKLQFKSHNYNIQNHEEIIEIQNIESIEFCNTLGFIPNGLQIKTKNGEIEKFVVSGRRLWKEKIEKIKDVK